MRYSMDRVIKAGAGPRVHVVIQYDGPKPNDSQRLTLEVASEDEKSSRFTILEKDVEYDMGKTETLVDFVGWGRKNFPSEKTILLVSAHGRGVLNIPASDNTKFGSDSSEVLALASSSDDTSETYMNETSLTRGLEKVLKGKKLDLLIYNACMMGNLEVMNIFSSVARYAIASEYSIYVTLKEGEKLAGQGINIEHFLSYLNHKPDFNERDLARVIVQDFQASYINFESSSADSSVRGENRYPSTLAFYDLSRIHQLSSEVSKTLVEFRKLAQKSPDILPRFFAENMLSHYVDSLGYIDIMNFYASLVKSMDPANHQERQDRFKKILDQVVLEKVGLFAESNEELGHLSFFFPRISTDLAYVLRFTGDYAKIPVTQKYGWDQFAQYFWMEAVQQADNFWISLLQDWEAGATVFVEPGKQQDLAEYYLFLYLDMLPIKWKQLGQMQKVQDYLQELRRLHRDSPYLRQHISYTESLLKH